MGIFWASLTYVVWGLTPIFWKQLSSVGSLEILGQRVFWSILCLLPFVFFKKECKDQMKRLLTVDRHKLPYVALGAFMISLNWYMFVLAMLTNRVLQCSLGYFMTPLMSILLSIFLLRERLTRLQKIAVGLALLATVVQTIQMGQPPQLALVLSLSFAIYAFLKKKVQITAETGLAMEMFFMLPFAAWLWKAHGSVNHTASEWTYLFLTGPLTVIPMIWYTWALHRISFVSVAFLQYLSPIIQFFLAIFLYREPFALGQRINFIMTWIALGIFMWDLWLRTSHSKKAPPTELRPAA